MLIPLPLSPSSRRLSLSTLHNLVYGFKESYISQHLYCVAPQQVIFCLLYRTKLSKNNYCVLLDFALKGSWLLQSDLLTNFINSLSGLVFYSHPTGFKLLKHVFKIEPRCLFPGYVHEKGKRKMILHQSFSPCSSTITPFTSHPWSQSKRC